MDKNLSNIILIIQLNKNIIGIYDNNQLALDFIYSLLNSKIINKSDNVIIQKYKINTSIILEEFSVNLNYTITQKKNINYYEIDESISKNEDNSFEIYEEDSICLTTENSEDSLEQENQIQNKKKYIAEQNKLGQEKILITHQLNLLKEQSKQEEEEENKYNTDIELFNQFKNIKIKNTSFVIPFLFDEKYKYLKN